MQVGIQLVLQNYLETTTDDAVLDVEYRLAELAEPLGFDSIWCVEHHFDWYSMGPDTPQILAYLAGRTQRIKLATGAVILPWNDPLRVVEKMILLDHQSKGRAHLRHGPRPGAHGVRRLPDRHERGARPLRRGGAHDPGRARDRDREGRRPALPAEAGHGAAEAARLVEGPHLHGGDVAALDAALRGARRAADGVRAEAVGGDQGARGALQHLLGEAPQDAAAGADLRGVHDLRRDRERGARPRAGVHRELLPLGGDALRVHQGRELPEEGLRVVRGAGGGARRLRRRQRGEGLRRDQRLRHAGPDPREAARAARADRRLQPVDRADVRRPARERRRRRACA